MEGMAEALARRLLRLSRLPRILEICAILRERGTDPSTTLSLVAKWGPSIRTIVDIADRTHFDNGGNGDGDDEFERRLGRSAMRAAARICADVSLVDNENGMGGSDEEPVSDVLFFTSSEDLRGPRDSALPSSSSSSSAGEDDEGSFHFIPTSYLFNILDQNRRESSLSNARTLELSRLLSSHSFTRSAAAWAHESEMHKRLACGTKTKTKEKLTIWRYGDGDGGAEMTMRPSSNILPGMLASLGTVSPSEPFYWIPSAMDFTGVDAVLGDKLGNIFVLRATISARHGSPPAGLSKIFGHFREDVRERCAWHFVVVAKDFDLEYAHKLAAEYTTEEGGWGVQEAVDGLVLRSVTYPKFEGVRLGM